MYNITLWHVHITSQMCKRGHTTLTVEHSCLLQQCILLVLLTYICGCQQWKEKMHSFCIVGLHINANNAFMVILCFWRQ
jgi:hypothetical protein